MGADCQTGTVSAAHFRALSTRVRSQPSTSALIKDEKGKYCLTKRKASKYSLLGRNQLLTHFLRLKSVVYHPPSLRTNIALYPVPEETFDLPETFL